VLSTLLLFEFFDQVYFFNDDDYKAYLDRFKLYGRKYKIVSSYIELNPMRAKIVWYPDEYLWSSY